MSTTQVPLLQIRNLKTYFQTEAGTAKVPPGLLEEVFELNEQLDEIREARESGADAAGLSARLQSARAPIDAKRDAHERQLDALAAQWDAQIESGAAAAEARRATLDALRERLLERNYINNLLATIEREVASLGIGNQDSGIGRG